MIGFRISLLLFLMLALSTNMEGQHIQLVRNINCCPITPIDSDYGSRPRYFTVMGDKLYFFALTETEGGELWVTEGDSASTHMVVSIFPGIENGVDFSTNGSGMVSLDDKLIFVGNTHLLGREPYVSDGTAAGTHLLKDIINGSIGSAPSNFMVVGDKVMFLASDTVNGSGLWSTDGSEQGTIPITTGAWNFYIWNNKLYFHKDQGLWVSDGTVAGTYQVKANCSFPDPGQCFEYQDKLFFYGGVPMGFPSFGTNSGFWQTDGTENGTTFFAGGFTQYGYIAEADCIFNNKIFFSAKDTNFTNYYYQNYEIWESDGTVAGTHQFCDINNDSTTGSDPTHFFTLNDKLYFQKDVNGRHLMSTNGINPSCSFVSNDFLLHTKKNIYRIDSFSFLTIAESSSLYWFYFKDPFAGSYLPTYLDGTTEIGGDIDFTSDPVVYKNTIYFSGRYKDIGYELYKINLGDFPVSTTAITDADPNDDVENVLQIFPNPVRSTLNITCKVASEMSFRNTMGQFEFKQNIKPGRNVIDVSFLNEGTHFATFVTKDGIRKTSKVIKVN